MTFFSSNIPCTAFLHFVDLSSHVHQRHNRRRRRELNVECCLKQIAMISYSLSSVPEKKSTEDEFNNLAKTKIPSGECLRKKKSSSFHRLTLEHALFFVFTWEDIVDLKRISATACSVLNLACVNFSEHTMVKVCVSRAPYGEHFFGWRTSLWWVACCNAFVPVCVQSLRVCFDIFSG